MDKVSSAQMKHAHDLALQYGHTALAQTLGSLADITCDAVSARGEGEAEVGPSADYKKTLESLNKGGVSPQG